MINTPSVTVRIQRHIDESGHVVQSTLYADGDRLLSLVQCDGCDFRDWVSEIIDRKA